MFPGLSFFCGFLVPETKQEPDNSENRLSLLNVGGFEFIFIMREGSQSNEKLFPFKKKFR